jgi:hypothetical protein
MVWLREVVGMDGQFKEKWDEWRKKKLETPFFVEFVVTQGPSLQAWNVI